MEKSNIGDEYMPKLVRKINKAIEPNVLIRDYAIKNGWFDKGKQQSRKEAAAKGEGEYDKPQKKGTGGTPQG